jgi:molecular chaperone HscB
MYKDDQNPFELLGMEPTFEVDLALLDEAYFARQSLAHPDRFVYHSEPERIAASAQASSLNWAYETLKNPMLRAKALLKIRGIEVGGEDGKTIQNFQLLEEMMGLQDALSEAMIPHDLSQVESQVQERLQGVKSSFALALRQDDSIELGELFLRLTYLSKLMSDIKLRQRQSSIKTL